MDRFDLNGDAAPGAALGKHAHIAAIAVQIQQIGEHVNDAKRLRLQNACFGLVDVSPRSPFPAAHRGCIAGRGLCGQRLVGARHQGRAYRRKRRVVGDGIDLPFGRQFQRSIHHFVHAVHHGGVNTRILKSQLQVVLANAAGKHHHVFLACQLFEIAVPNPGNVAAVGLIVVDEERRNLLARRLGDELHVLIEARGVLRQVQKHRTSLDGERLQAPVLRVEQIDRFLEHRIGNARAVRRQPRGHHVVHHVRARTLGMQFNAVARCCFFDRKRDFVAKHHVLCGVVELRAAKAAVGARVGAQLTILTIAVGEHSRTALAHLGIGHHILTLVHVFAHAERNGLVGDALRDDGAQWVVGVVEQRGVGRLFQCRGNGVLHAVDFAAAVKLVTEQVQQQHVGCLHLRQGVGQPQLVRFEHAPFNRALGLQQRGCHTVCKVGTSAVAGNALALALKRVGNHVGNGGFAVGAHHHDGAFRDLVHGFGDNTRIYLQGNFAGHVRRRPVRQMAQTPRTQRACHISHCLANAHDRPFHDSSFLSRSYYGIASLHAKGCAIAHRNTAETRRFWCAAPNLRPVLANMRSKVRNIS